MTTTEARRAMHRRIRVTGGEGEDRDSGYILTIVQGMATMAWSSGVRTRIPISELSVASE